MTEAPSPFSPHIPNLQVAWDSTSLRALMECPRKYQYSIIQGWRPIGEKVDLEFGGYFASSVEKYRKARLEGKTKQEATIAALRYVVEATWIRPQGDERDNGEPGGPWGGKYENLWHCRGTEPYKNAKGNKAKCPYSHKGVWLPAPAPDVCGTCGSACETQRQWVSNDKVKDRYTLIRLVAWYCDEQPEQLEDGLFPYAFPNGQPAVELSFTMPLPWSTPGWKWEGDDMHRATPIEQSRYILCGHLDGIVQFGYERFIDDNKTTKNALSAKYFAAYSPHIQMDVYDLAGSVLYPSLGLKGVIVEGAQVLQEGARFGMGIQYRTDKLREELLEDLRYWIKQAEQFAAKNYWPMNRASCYLCPFKDVCSKDPGSRQMYLEANYVKQPWNPLQER